MNAILMMLRKLRTDQNGATAIEYGLICALIAVSIMGGLQLLGGGSGGMWTKIEDRVDNSM